MRYYKKNGKPKERFAGLFLRDNFQSLLGGLGGIKFLVVLL